MSDPLPPPVPPLAALPAALALEVDGACDDFERFWRRARRRAEPPPEPAAFLGRVCAAARPALAAALEALRRELLEGSDAPGVPGYTFMREIARGPMGVVHHVRRDADGRDLALKAIQSAGLACWARCLRLRAEGEVLTELRHPHIVPVEAFGEHEGLHYLVMPLVTGGDLRQRREEFALGAGGRDRARRIRALMGKVAGAVAFLHGRGVLHRDLKPSNILLTAPGAACEPLVCDFGLAGRLHEPGTPLPAAEVVGTLAYMAPEQMEGRQALSVEADVWGLGAVLYELLTGRPPFAEGGRVDARRKQSEPGPPDTAAVHPAAADAALNVICRRCLRRDPAARYHSAADLAEDLLRA